MKKIYLLAIAAWFPLAAYSQSGIPTPPTSTNVMPEQTIELKDGTRIVHTGNGTMYHVDEKGRRLNMMGKMEAKDGSVYIMRNGYVWKRIATGERPHTP